MRLMLPAVLALSLSAGPAWSINIELDYRFDETGHDFFGAGNPGGVAGGNAARETLEAAASFFSGILEDTFTGGSIPDPVPVASVGGNWVWNISFTNPATGVRDTISSNLTNGVDEYRIFVGGRPLGGNTLGLGGPGGFGSGPRDSQGNLISGQVSVTSREDRLIDEGNASFAAGFRDRGETSGFSGWGGSVTFSSSAGIDWHYDRSTQPGFGESDFYSVALHEIAHVLGYGQQSFGRESIWESLTSGTTFVGAATVAEFGGPAPLEDDRVHWEEGTISTRFGTNTPQETLLDPTINAGDRKLLTSLDAASLIDLGWEINEPAPPIDLAGDYNGDRTVDAADYTIWRSTAGTPGVIGSYTGWQASFGQSSVTVVSTPVPEPTGLGLVGLAAGLAAARRRRARC